MASPRKSARKRTSFNYGNLIGDDSDDDFFGDDCDSLKLSKRTKRPPSDDEFDVKSALESPKKPKARKTSTKAPKPSVASKPKKAAPVKEAAPVLTREPLVTVNSVNEYSPPPVSSAPITKAAPPKKPPELSIKSPPAVPTPSRLASPLVCVTPTSGLRLGLSRKNISKPLHPNVRISK